MSIAVLFVAALALGAPEVQVGDLEGGLTVGTLTQLSPEKLTLKSAEGEVTLPLDRLLHLTPKSPPSAPAASDKPAVWIELVDGSKLTANGFTVHHGTTTIGVGAGEGFELPAKTIRTVRFSRPGDPQSALWPADVGAHTAADLLAVRKKDNVDFLEGVLGDISDEKVEFQFQGETIPVQRTKVDGLIYFQKAGDKLPDPVCVVDDARGWRLQAKTISLSAGGLELTTLSDARLQLPWELVTRIDFSPGKIAYLSDLEPETVQWTPYLDVGNAPAVAQFYAPRRDAGRDQPSLQVGGKQYAKGLALYSRTAIVYRVPAGMKRFKAVAGIDDGVRDSGRLRLEISADGKKLFDQSLGGKDAPVELDLDLAGARRMSILVDYGDNLDLGDYLNLGDARMVK